MGKVLEGQCVSGTEALWVALHGFAFALVALVVGIDHLSPTALSAVLAGGGMYLLTLAEVAEHATLLEWAPLVLAVAGAGLLAQGGARYASGKGFLPETLTKGQVPAVFLSVLGGYVLAQFQTQGMRVAEEWIPLALAAAAAGLFAASGARYGSSKAAGASASFVPPVLTEGQGPRNILLALGVFVVAAFLGKVEGQQGSWEQWIALGSAAAAAGLVANGGARYAQGGAFFPESLTTGLIPTAVMALLGAFVYTAFSDAVAAKAMAAAGSGKKRGWGATSPPPVVVGGLEEWMPLTFTAALAGLVAMGASRYGQDKPLVPTGLWASKRAQGPALLTLALGAYTVLALGAVTDKRGGLTLWLNLTGAATVVGALSSFHNGGRKRPQPAT